MRHITLSLTLPEKICHNDVIMDNGGSMYIEPTYSDYDYH